MADSDDDWALAIAGAAPRDVGDDGSLALVPVSSRPTLSGPRERTKLQHHFLASRMREAKAMKAKQREDAKNAVVLNKALAYAQKSFSKRKVRVSIVKNRNKRYKGLVLRVQDGAGRSRRCGMSFDSMLQIADDRVSGMKNVARSFDVSHHTVRHIKGSVANSVVKSRRVCMEKVDAGRRDATAAYIVSNLCFDEARKTLRTTMQDAGSDDETKMEFRGSWQVMNCMQRHLIGFDKDLDADNNSIVEVDSEFFRPPVRMLTVSGPTTYDSLHNAHQEELNCPFQASLEQEATYAAKTYDRDGAGVNTVAVSHAFKSMDETKLGSDRVCGNHSNSLCECVLLAIIGATIMIGVYALTTLFRMGSNWCRFVLSIPQVVEAAVSESNITRGRVSANDKAHAREIKNYALSHFRDVWERGKRRRRNLRKRKKSLM